MAMTAMAMQNTQIGPVQYADMQMPLRVPFAVDGALDMRPTYNGRTVTVNTGSGMIGGSRVKVASAEAVTIPAVSSGGRWDAVCVRVDWRNSTTKAVVLTGATINTTTTADNAKINRIPGSVYDAIIALVYSTAGASTLSQVVDMRPYGGYGMPYVLDNAALDKTSYLDLPAGTMVENSTHTRQLRRDNDGVWRAPSGAAASANTMILRDAAGRAQVASPSAAADISTKSYVDEAISAALQVATIHKLVTRDGSDRGYRAVKTGKMVTLYCHEINDTDPLPPLPAGWRPIENLEFTTQTYGGEAGTWQVTTTGVIQPAYRVLSGGVKYHGTVSFVAEK